MAQPAQVLTPGLATAPVPPQNLDAEESVLGAMMLSPGAIGAVSEILDAGDFYRETHATIYRAALGLYAKGEPVDAITLVDELDRLSKLADVGGQERVHELAALTISKLSVGEMDNNAYLLRCRATGDLIASTTFRTASTACSGC